MRPWAREGNKAGVEVDCKGQACKTDSSLLGLQDSVHIDNVTGSHANDFQSKEVASNSILMCFGRALLKSLFSLYKFGVLGS